VTPADALRERAREYELLAAWHAERGPFSPASATSAVGFIVAAIVLREVALALDDDFEAAA
jgi:hypothetical protein